jgi:hypothetical protein
MALNWNITNCKDSALLQTDDEWPITNALIWATMSVGIRDITEKTVPEFYARLSVWESIVGPMFYEDDENGKTTERGVTLDDLRKRIGLHTNASSMTRAEWRKNIAAYLDRKADDYKRRAEQQLEAKEAA